jgi:sulfatase maturation enzyme AslB (radical SAM superfamily)
MNWRNYENLKKQVKAENLQPDEYQKRCLECEILSLRGKGCAINIRTDKKNESVSNGINGGRE